MTTITLSQISRQYGNVQALHPTDLTCPSGQLTVLVGPSGCGKTTLLRLIAGLVEPTSGRLHLGERDITDVPVWDRQLAMVFQNYALYPHMSVAQNLAFPLDALRVPKKEKFKRVRTVAAQLGIEHLLHRKPRQLSGGQQQRVALGRALIREPEGFLLDEPLSNLDAALRTDTRGEIKRLQRENDLTMVYVTHDQVEAMTLADQLVVMREGQIQQVAPPDEVYRYPVNQYVAGFLGSPPMNFLYCTYSPTEDGGFMAAGQWWRPMPQEWGEVPFHVTLGLRPESVWVDIIFDPEEYELMPAEVVLVEPLGRETVLTLTVLDADNQPQTWRAVIDPDERVRVGDMVRLSFHDRSVHFFDRVTGQRLTKP